MIASSVTPGPWRIQNARWSELDAQARCDRLPHGARGAVGADHAPHLPHGTAREVQRPTATRLLGAFHGTLFHGTLLEYRACPHSPRELPSRKLDPREHIQRMVERHAHGDVGGCLESDLVDASGERLNVHQIGDVAERRCREPSATRLLPRRPRVHEEHLGSCTGK